MNSEIDLSNESSSFQNFYAIGVKLPRDLSGRKDRSLSYKTAKYCLENGGLSEGETLG